jgi:hypothetical protein
MEITDATMVTTLNRQSAALVKIADVLADPANSTACSAALLRQLLALCANGLRWTLPVPGRNLNGYNRERNEVVMNG